MRSGVAFPESLSPWQRWLWRRLPRRVRTRFNPTDNWTTGYLAGLAAGRANMEAKWLGNLTGEGPYANYPPPTPHHTEEEE